MESGEYEIQIGKNAQDIVLSRTIYVESEHMIPKVFTLNTTMGEILADPKGKAVFEQAMSGMVGSDAQEMESQALEGDGEAISAEMMAATMEAMPLRQMISFVPGVTKEALTSLVKVLNDNAGCK